MPRKRRKAYDHFGLEIHYGKICVPTGPLMQPIKRIKLHQNVGTLTVVDLDLSSTLQEKCLSYGFNKIW